MSQDNQTNISVWTHDLHGRYIPDQHSYPKYLKLGASLYVPGNHNALAEIGDRLKFPKLHSVIFCTEDSVHADEMPFVLTNLERALIKMDTDQGILRYIRVRSPEVLSQCLQMSGINKIDGFVLPKVTSHNLEAYLSQFRREDPFDVMVTLETLEAFDHSAMMDLRSLFLIPIYHKRILSIRIGGNDLLNIIGIRRSREHTVYDTPLSHTISMLVNVFKPYGFNLTAPVCDYLNAPELLRREVKLDLSYGLFGKTAIHPDQVAMIEEQYQVSQTDLEMAEAILDPSRPAVFRMYDSMCEPATHSNWAEQIIARADIYGVTA
jgi:citrate lyase beta subunit